MSTVDDSECGTPGEESETEACNPRVCACEFGNFFRYLSDRKLPDYGMFIALPFVDRAQDPLRSLEEEVSNYVRRGLNTNQQQPGQIAMENILLLLKIHTPNLKYEGQSC